MDSFHPPSRKDYLDRQQKQGRGLFGVFPGRYPREIFWTLNVLPVEVWDPPLDTSGSGAHLQPTICSVVKSGLELIRQGRCGMLDGFLFPHTCDSLQNLGSLVRDDLRVGKPCLDFYPSKIPDGPVARAFFRKEIERLSSALEPLYGPLDSSALSHWAARARELAEALETLYSLRAEGRLDTTNVEFYRLVRSVEFMHPDDLIPVLSGFLKDRVLSEPLTSPAIVLSGVLPTPWGLLSLLDDLGVRIGDDDLLSCGRRIPGVCGSEKDPVAAVMESYFGMPPCSTTHAPLGERALQLLERVHRSRARGVLFSIVKFCEPELFAYPALRDSLKRQGIGTLFLEHDVNREVPGQVATRLEAFVEMIEDRGSEEMRNRLKGPGGVS